MKSKSEERYLATLWSPPDMLPTQTGAGSPLVCCATTFTFHADFFENELLTRFLGLRYDEMEGELPFVLEREEALSSARVAVLVDAACVSGNQRTLRWDQIPVFVPQACQHAKVTLLAWENCVRVIVASANLTTNGYKWNREIVGAFTFCNHETSAPLQLATDVIDFLTHMTGWTRADAPVRERLRDNLSKVRATVTGWTAARPKFGDRESPRAVFVPGYPAIGGAAASRVLEKTRELWGATVRADEITVMTPFIGQHDADFAPLLRDLLQIPRTRTVEAFLAVPRRRPADDKDTQVRIDLPKAFLAQWTKAWRAAPRVFAVPQRREGEPRDRPLHAKGILIANEEKDRGLLLCGSSNFSLHGMGVMDAPNIEANLVYIDAVKSKNRLDLRMPADWDADEAEDALWSDQDVPGEDDERQGSLLPPVFQWATYNQAGATITFGFKGGAAFPGHWRIDLPGNDDDALTLLSDDTLPKTAPDTHVCALPAALKRAHIVALRVIWNNDADDEQSAPMLVHALKYDDLLPPEACQGLSASTIIDCLIDRKDLADKAAETEDPLAPVQATVAPVQDTTHYLLYRIRRLGLALGLMGARLLTTPRSADALFYRLHRDPLGPVRLAEALVREYEPRRDRPSESEAMRFALAEIALMVAHTGRRWHADNAAGEPDLRALFADCVAAVDAQSAAIPAPEAAIAAYARRVAHEAQTLLTAAAP